MRLKNTFLLATWIMQLAVSPLGWAAPGQTVQSQRANLESRQSDITTLDTDLAQVNAILEAVLGKDSHKQAKLVSLRTLGEAGVSWRDRIRQTLKKDVYSFDGGDMENLKVLLTAINVPQAIVYKRFINVKTKDFPPMEKQSLNQAIDNILKFSGTVNPSTTNPRRKPPPPALSDEVLMQPIIAEDKAFVYGQAASNQLTPVAMCFVDLDFFNQTGGGDAALMRNMGTLKLLLLAHAQVIKGIKVYALSDSQKEKLANDLLTKESRLLPNFTPGLTNEKINQLYDKARADLLKKTNPQLNCPRIRHQFGLE